MRNQSSEEIVAQCIMERFPNATLETSVDGDSRVFQIFRNGNLVVTTDSIGAKTVELDMSKIDCYLLGSPTGGTGTECSHTIKGEKIAEFLAATNIATCNELRKRAAKFSAKE
jgi:CO dehydrogenase/acetyl-CoA synthase gamma subunit (corrinoid Fe-S protein)